MSLTVSGVAAMVLTVSDGSAAMLFFAGDGWIHEAIKRYETPRMASLIFGILI
jgi:hypothetical protein